MIGGDTAPRPVVLDLLLPNDDGTRLLEDIKNNPKLKDIPVAR